MVGAERRRSRERRAHDLKTITKLRYPRRFVFFDSESRVKGYGQYRPDVDTKPHVPRLVVAEAWDSEDEGATYVEREAPAFHGADCGPRFWRWLSDVADKRHDGRRGSVVAIAHNVGYDVLATGGAAALHGLGWSSEAPYEKGPVYIWRFRRQGQTITLLSSTNFYAIKLAKLGATFGYPKLDTDTQTDDLAELERYCRRDVEICRASILGLVRFLRTGAPDGGALGPWADTISSVAFKAYRYGFLSHRIALHVDPDATALERAAYFGGRTEVEYRGVECPLPVYDLDVNSLYPSVMLGNLFPTRLLQVRDGDLPALLDAVATGALVIADVDVETEVPCVPYRDAVLGKLIFPVGAFSTTLCSPELRVAVGQARITAVRKWAVYDGAAIFTDYVATLYARRVKAREDGLEAWVQLYKNLLNNLYGKFGQKSEEWVVVGNADPDEVSLTEHVGPDGSTIVERVFGGQRWVIVGATEGFNSFCAVAAFVTSYARCALWGAMNVAGNYDPAKGPFGPSGREFYYCDTDSLFVSEAGYRRLAAADMVSKDTLGKLKIERLVEKRAVFYGAKVYDVDGKVYHKGLPADARSTWDDGTPVLTPDGQPAKVYDAWPKLASAIRRGDLSAFANRQVVKKVDVAYDKATVWSDGWTTPLRLPRASDDEATPSEGTYTVRLLSSPRKPP